MLKGIDISHHNKYQVRSGDIDFSKYDFIMMKASEGRTYHDPMMDDYVAMLGTDQLYGFYHYARPENNDPYTEAKNFCDAVGTYGYGAILALDWEGKAVKYDPSWAVEWLNEVEKKYGKKPLFYCSSYYTKHTGKILENNNGLWVAHYTKADKPRVYTYPFYAMWQYTNEPFDKDYFNGNKSAWMKYVNN